MPLRNQPGNYADILRLMLGPTSELPDPGANAIPMSDLAGLLGVPPTDENLGGAGGYGRPYPSQDPLAAPPVYRNVIEPPRLDPVRPRNPLQTVAMALADALNTKAAVKAGRPAPESFLSLRDQRLEAERVKKYRVDQERYQEETRKSERGEDIKFRTEAEQRAIARENARVEGDRAFSREQTWLAENRQLEQMKANQKFQLDLRSQEDQAAMDRIMEERKTRKMEAADDNSLKWRMSRDASTLEALDAFIGGDTGTALQDRFTAAWDDPEALDRVIGMTERTWQSTLRRVHTDDGREETRQVISAEIFPLLERARERREELKSEQQQTGGGMRELVPGWAQPLGMFGMPAAAAAYGAGLYKNYKNRLQPGPIKDESKLGR